MALKNNKVKNNMIFLSITVAIAFMLSCFIAISFCLFSNNQKVEASPRTSELTQQIQECDQKLAEASNVYTQALMDVEDSQAKIDEANANLQYCNEKIPQLQGYIGTNIKRLYCNDEDKGEIFRNILTSSTSISNLFKCLAYYDSINKKQADSIKEFNELKAQAARDKEICEVEHARSMEAFELAKATKDEADALSQDLHSALAQATEEEKEAARPKPSRGRMPAQGDTSGDWGWIASIALGMCDGTHMYHFGDIGPDTFDCSGFVSYCINGGKVGRRGNTWTFLGWAECSPTPGCICVNAQHCGIYVGGGNMVHAPCDGEAVQVGPVQGGMVFRAPCQ